MKTIQLTQGFVAMVDDEDYEWLSKFKWCAKKDGGRVYANRARRANGKPSTVTMHQEIMKTSPGVRGDHIDGNGLNNQRSNLRTATQTQNRWNTVRLNKNNTSTATGVQWLKSRNRWIAVISHKTIGLFRTFEGAKVARRLAEIALYGEFAPQKKD